MRALPLLLAVGLVSPALGAEPADFYYADADHTVVDIQRDSLGLLLNGEVRAWRTGDAVLKLADPADLAFIDRIESWPEVAYAEEIDASRGLYRVLSARGADEIALANRIAEQAEVTFCHPDLEVEFAPETLNDPYLAASWHLHNDGSRGGLAGVDVGAFEAWETTMGEGQIIAIIDTGIDPNHPDLDLLPGYDFGDQDDDPSPEPSYDGHGHGTAMAGVAAAIGDNGIGVAGIAPKAKILPIKLIGDGGTFVDVHDAFVYAVDEGASVLSNSWGYSANGCPTIPLPAIIREGIDYAENVGRDGRGAAVAMSLGNGGCDASNDGFHDHPTLISVGAATDRDEKAGYSNFGDNLEIMGFGAGNGRPGLWTTDVTGTDGYNGAEDGDYWDNASGTSSACASVSGVLALMFAANERLTAAEAREVLCATAVKHIWDESDWDENGRSRYYGCGRIDAAAAVATVADLTPSVSLDDPGPQTQDHIRLSWLGEDPDGDDLSYRLQVRIQAAPDAEPHDAIVDEIITGETAVLDGMLLPGSVNYAWTVTPIDRWGEGVAVDGAPFVVAVAEEPKGGCSAVSAPVGLSLSFLGFLAVFAARRGRRDA